MKGTIYLSGPITGLTYEGCTDWRKYVRDYFPNSVTCLSPMRGKAFLAGLGEITDRMQAVTQSALAQDKAIVGRDFWDTTRSDFLLVNLKDAPRVSIGTMFEMAWAFQNHIPVVLVMDENDKFHEHAFVREAATYRVANLQSALDIITIALGTRP